MTVRVSDPLPAVFDAVLGIVPGRGEAQAELRNALKQLCEKGQRARKAFDPRELARFLEGLCVLARPRSYGQREPELLRYGRGEREYFTQADLRRTAKRAKVLIEDIGKVKRTLLVAYLQITSQIPAGDMLTAPYLGEGEEAQLMQWLRAMWSVPVHAPAHDPFLAPLNTIAELPALARRYGKCQFRVDYLLWLLCRYVKDTTGSWDDRRLSDILRPLKIPHSESADALKVWRHRMGAAK